MAAKDKLPDDVPPVPTPPSDAAAPPPVEAPPAAAAPAAAPPPPATPGYQAAPPPGAPPVPPPPAANPYSVPQPYSVAQPGQPAYGQPAYGQPGYGQPAAPNGLSIASLILGIAGVVLALFYGFGFLPALAGVITGHLASKRQPQSKPLWVTGLITGYIGIAISVIWGIAIVVFIGFMAAYPAG